MNSLKPLAQGVVADLRTRGLLPVALVLVVAVVAVPVLLSRSPEAVPVEAAAAVEAVDTGGLPGPAEALGERPLVTLASLENASDLKSFSPRDPFKPLRTLSAIDADPAGVPAGVTDAGATPAAVTGGSGGDAPGAGFGGPVGGDPSTGGDTGGDDGSPTTPGGDTGGGTPTEEQPAPERRFTYAVDLSFSGPDKRMRRYNDFPRLSMLPNESGPLLIFLGVGDDLSDVVFLVDARLRAVPGGEGKCSPSPEDCATVALEPGEQQVFLDDQDQRYLLRIEQIREVPLGDAAQKSDARTADTAKASIGEPVRRFLPQLLTELLVIGGQP